MIKKLLLPAAITGVAILGAIGLIKMRAEPEQSEVSESFILVETMSVSPGDANITINSQGTVAARTQTTLVSEVSGQVIDVSKAFVAGGFFHKGDQLLKLDDSNYRAAVSRNEAALAGALSALEQERGQADVAEREWNNMSADQQKRIRAKELYLRKPQLAEAEAQLKSAQADLEQAKNDLRKTSIIAPYDGLVSSKNTDIGQFVNAGTTLAETFAIDYAEVRLPIPETKLAYLNLPSSLLGANSGQQATGPRVELISNLGDKTYTWSGQLTRTEGVLDTRTRVMYSVVQISDPYGLYGREHEQPLRIGTYVNAAISGTQLHDVFILPRHTLQSNAQVWVADQENRLRSRVVEVITVNGDNAYVKGGILPGDQVVITRMENPLNGMAVQTAVQMNPVN